MNTKPLRLLQLTDPHLGALAAETLIGLNTEESFKDVLSLIRDSGIDYDLIIGTGDISNDGSVASYQRFIDAVREYLPNVPLAWLPGNHDNPKNMATFPRQTVWIEDFSLGQWQFLLLNSRIPFEEGGELSPGELARLERALSLRPERNTLILLHHQPVPVGSEWIDQYVVKNAPQFFALLERFPNVKAVSWGHVHQAFEATRGALKLFASPSTCVQFTPESQNFQVDHLMPGCRSYLLYPDGSIDSTVLRAKDRIYCIDYSSTGY
ncbi:MAG: 3',5'-cyclic-AMP phosphodiesterase [Marinagarivorans sp.]